MKLTANFTLEEFQASGTAKKYNIDNTIPEKYRDNVFKLAQTLQTIRDVYGQPIIVGSGYRCPAVNTKVGGVINSDHKYAAAADIKTKSDKPSDNKILFDLIVKLANEGKIKCRQILDEYNYDWIHISINHKDNPQKNNQVLHIK